MSDNLLKKQVQKYSTLLLITITAFLSGFLLVRKGIVAVPTFGIKEKVVDIRNPSVVDILFRGKGYQLSFAEMDPRKLSVISKYDKSEQWQGTGIIEEEQTMGGSVMFLTERDGKKASAWLSKNLQLEHIDAIKFAVYMRSDPDDFETLNIVFGDKSGENYYRFAITQLQVGINYFSIPKNRFLLVGGKSETRAMRTSFSWDNIERVQFELISRPEGKVSLDIGWIRGEKNDAFDSDWSWDKNEHFLNLDIGQDGKPTLLAQNVGKGVATLKKVSSVKDFTYSTRLTSARRGTIGLFLRGDFLTLNGYYLTIGGVGTNEWAISKFGMVGPQAASTVLLKGQIANYEFNADTPIWLKANVKGNNISAFLSLDGNTWTELGNITDNEFAHGGIGIATSEGGAGYFDEFNLRI